LTDELAPKSGAQPNLASRNSPDPADFPNTLDASSGVLSDIGSKPLLPVLVTRTSTPPRAARVLPVGILLYLFSVGIVAAATVGILFGIGLFLLAQPKEPMNASAVTGEHDSDSKPSLPSTLSNASSTYGDIASVPIEPQIPRSAATAALPVVPAAAPAALPSPSGDVPASDAKDQSLGKGAPASEARAASPDVSPPAALTAEPVTSLSIATPAPVEAQHLSAGQITELLARGDSFLHAGDVASARLFYERAADAGDWQAAIRMGATFDPAFLGRVGVRTVSDPSKAQSWYHHALDLGAPKTDRQVGSPKTN
jgi:TPR repeat protein